MDKEPLATSAVLTAVKESSLQRCLDNLGGEWGGVTTLFLSNLSDTSTGNGAWDLVAIGYGNGK